MCIWNSNVFSWQKCHVDKRLRKSGCQRSANTEFPKLCTLSERLEQNKGPIPSSYLTIHSSGNLISIFSWRCTTQQPQLLKMARTNDKEGNQFLSWGWKIDAIPYFNWGILQNAPRFQTNTNHVHSLGMVRRPSVCQPLSANLCLLKFWSTSESWHFDTPRFGCDTWWLWLVISICVVQVRCSERKWWSNFEFRMKAITLFWTNLCSNEEHNKNDWSRRNRF